MSVTEDRNDTPGLSMPPIDVSRCRQLTGHTVESSAVHSRSKGWLPRVKLDLHHIPLIGPGEKETLELMLDPADIRQLMLVLRGVADRADEDAKRGLL